MPVYEYICPNCQHVFEEWLKISEAVENAPCPKCGSPSQHIISNTAFVLKGSGWYVTDYGYRKGTGEDGPTATSDSGTSPTPAAADASEQGASPAPAATVPSPSAPGTANDVSA